MNRRDTLLALLAFGTGLHSTTHAQAQVRRIGFLSPDGANHPNGERTRAAFPAALKRLGYEEGRNLAIEWRWAQAKWDSLPALAADLVRLKVELIVARINQPIEAAMRATQTIPIVMFNANYPVELGLVQSLARPGGNVTGTSFRSPQVLEKLLQLLREIAPKAIRIALPWEGAATRMNGAGKISVQAYERAAARLGMKIQYFDAVRGEEVEGLIERIAASPVEALVLHGAAVFRPYFAQLIAAANARGIAVVGAVDTIAQRGGLLDYSPDDLNYYDRTASYVDRILKGASPAELPVEEPTKINLHVNLKTAKAIGLKVPQSILARADWMIE